MAETNALTIEPDTVQKLLLVGHDIEAMSTRELREMFPHELSREDIGTIGSHVLQGAEQQLDQGVEDANPAKIHRKTLFMIGFAALGRLDMITTDNVIAYLKEGKDIDNSFWGARLEQVRDGMLSA